MAINKAKEDNVIGDDYMPIEDGLKVATSNLVWKELTNNAKRPIKSKSIQCDGNTTILYYIIVLILRLGPNIVI